MVRPTVSPIQARVLGVVLGVSGFAFASVSGFAASHVSADTKIADNKVWVTAEGSDKGPAAGDFVRVISDCKDVLVWGNDLHNKSGDFTVYFDDHNGKDKQVEEMSWKYDKGGKDQQVIATIDAKELISDLKDKGFHAQDNGWHMDLKFSDPDRQVEFILDELVQVRPRRRRRRRRRRWRRWRLVLDPDPGQAAAGSPARGEGDHHPGPEGRRRGPADRRRRALPRRHDADLDRWRRSRRRPEAGASRGPLAPGVDQPTQT